MAAAGLAARFLPISNHIVLAAAAAAPYLMLGALASLIVFLVGRRWVWSVLATALVVAAIGVELPLYLPDAVHADVVGLRLMTANLYLGQADATSLVATANDRADVLAVQELTPDEVNRLVAAGLQKAFPYSVLDPRRSAVGGGLWSRFPITESTRRIPGYNLTMLTARIMVSGTTVDPAILVAHISGPWPQPIDGWRQELARMPDTIRDATQSATGGCAIVAGDFNATTDMKPFRQLLGDGFQDGNRQAGAGVTPTYPGNRRFPPLIAIDHILTRSCTVTSVQAVRVPGSDHRGLVAVITIPRSGTPNR